MGRHASSDKILSESRTPSPAQLAGAPPRTPNVPPPASSATLSLGCCRSPVEYNSHTPRSLAIDSDEARIYCGMTLIKTKLESAGIEYAVIGGVALQCHGMPNRKIHDFDIMTDASGMKLKLAFEDERIKMPKLACGIWRVKIDIDGVEVYGDIFDKDMHRPIPLSHTIHGFKIATLGELFVQKVRAVGQRQLRKDFYDLHWLMIFKEDQIQNYVDDTDGSNRAEVAATYRTMIPEDYKQVRKVLHLRRSDVRDIDPYTLGDAGVANTVVDEADDNDNY